MPLKSIDIFFIDDAKHARLWKNAIVVFDTSSLLDMYFYSNKTKQVVIDEIFKKLKERLWIPYQVNYEFLKNRSKVILKRIGSYNSLETELKDISTSLKKCQTGIGELKSKTKKDEKHPILDQKLFNKIDEIQKQHQSSIEALTEQIKEVIKRQTAEIEKTVENDVLFDAINTYFEVGNGFSFAEQLQLIDEGKKRGSNTLTTLDLGNNNILEPLLCRSNQLTSINLNNNNNLTELNCA